MAGDRSQVHFLIQVERDSAIEGVADRLRAEGLRVDRVLPRVGMVGATGSAELVERISRIPGVRRVREEGSMELPPFDEDIPQ